MPTNRTPKRLVSQGPTGDTVRQNISRIRKESGITSERLVQAMGELGYNMPRTAISEIENGGRRVSVDDLMALAVALNVNPNALLLPHYSGDVEMGHELTAVPDTVTGEEAWAWADGWQALPHHRADAPDVDESLTGMAKGRALAAKHAAEDGRGFLERVRPDGEDAGAREFLATVSETVGELEAADWLSLWFHSNNPERFDGKRNGPLGARVAAYPEGGWSDISRYFDRIKAELAGIIGSDTARPFIKEVLAKRGGDNGDD
jgi:transcriptional regulator with XRE-family HTH domain